MLVKNYWKHLQGLTYLDSIYSQARHECVLKWLYGSFSRRSTFLQIWSSADIVPILQELGMRYKKNSLTFSVCCYFFLFFFFLLFNTHHWSCIVCVCVRPCVRALVLYFEASTVWCFTAICCQLLTPSTLLPQRNLSGIFSLLWFSFPQLSVTFVKMSFPTLGTLCLCEMSWHCIRSKLRFACSFFHPANTW